MIKLIPILILLTSFNAYSDIKIEVTNTITGKTFKAEFEDDAEAITWRLEQESDDSWGKVGEYTVTQTDITAEVKAEKDKEKADKDSLDLLKVKYDDGSIKLTELVEYLKLKGI